MGRALGPGKELALYLLCPRETQQLSQQETATVVRARELSRSEFQSRLSTT